MKTPNRPKEWREVVDAAAVALQFATAREYGLVSGGFRVDVDRCRELLREGRELGYLPRAEAVENVFRAMVNGGRR